MRTVCIQLIERRRALRIGDIARHGPERRQLVERAERRTDRIGIPVVSACELVVAGCRRLLFDVLVTRARAQLQRVGHVPLFEAKERDVGCLRRRNERLVA